MTLTLIIIAAVAALVVAPMAVITIPIARKQYEVTFVRTSPDKWGRENSCPSNAEHCVMYDTGLEWAERNLGRMSEVSVVSEGLKLVGEFYDFGGTKAVIILSGRAEALKYSYYFAEPYEKLGYSVLVVDGRAHGLSEGRYSGVGVKECADIKRWMELLGEERGITDIVIHGLCIGSSTAIYLAAKNTPRLRQIVVEGPYISFYNVLKQRTRAARRPVFPVALEMALLIKKRAGVNVFREQPLRYVGRISMPVLFLCGRQDVSSLPKYSRRLFERCGSAEKRLVWFERGAHSHLRIASTEEYDRAVSEFITKHE